MKLKYILALVTFAGLCFSCKNAEDYKEVVFVTGAEQDVTARLTIDGPTSMGISATCSSKVNEDVAVSFAIDNSLIDGYNKKFNRNYKALPEGSAALSSDESAIKAGFSVSDPVMFDLKSTKDFEEGITYVVPISITKIKGAAELLQSCKTIYVVLNRIIITKAAYLNSNYLEVGNFMKDPNLAALPALSMEARVYVNKYKLTAPYISTIMGIEEPDENFLLRFGDGDLKPGQLQFQGSGTDKLTSPKVCDTKKWYHVAVTFDGKVINMYLDGQLEVSKQATRSAVVNLYDIGKFRFGRSSGGRPLDGYISEARVWTKVLTPADLINNMCYVDPASENLLAYWKFNVADAGGTTVRDVTGHGYDATAIRGAITFMEGVKCPE